MEKVRFFVVFFWHENMMLQNCFCSEKIGTGCFYEKRKEDSLKASQEEEREDISCCYYQVNSFFLQRE